jgi:hypothetical protein
MANGKNGEQRAASGEKRRMANSEWRMEKHGESRMIKDSE